MKRYLAGLLLLTCSVGRGFCAPAPLPDLVKDAAPDVQEFQPLDQVHLTGWVGQRVQLSETNRLAKIDTDRLLEGYRKRPGRQAWDGEHIGKWLHAATLAWVNTGDLTLRKKLDEVAVALVGCQLEDGYLGTYLAKDRWTEWDVWSHKYNLIGLITYMRYTGNRAPLEACRRMGDLLCTTFGDAPGQRDIITAGHHTGMAPTSVLEPMVLLYRFTGERRYLDFCHYILRTWEQPNGPKIISTLLAGKGVDKVGNAKAYEMLSCLNGALEYYRTTGDERCLQACVNAWEDIVSKRLYLTGASSYKEHFHGDYDLPNENNVGETCVTVTWLQFNAQLLRLTGKARYAEQLENVVLNQLFGAQRPDCAAWGYYVQLSGTKPYSDNMDGHCCLSSGPRGVALIPSFAVTTDHDGVVMNLYDAGVAKLKTPAGLHAVVTSQTNYPGDGTVRVSIATEVAEEFTARFRMPAWAHNARIEINGHPIPVERAPDGYASIKRTWTKKDNITLTFPMEPRLVVGDHSNASQVAFCYGPLVLAMDESLLPAPLKKLDEVTVGDPKIASVGLVAAAVPESKRTWSGETMYRLRTTLPGSNAPVEIPMVPFADAGGTGAAYRVWIPASR